MCGRYGRDIPWPVLRDALNLIRPAPSEAPNLAPDWDIRPTTRQWTVRAAADGHEMAPMRWGLIPFWHKADLKSFKLTTFNARSETAATSAVFKGPLLRRRCLIPASCWYEWTGAKGQKRKWRFDVAGADMFVFAGLWDRYTAPDGESVESFTILTRAAGPDLAPYHDRAPVIAPPDLWAQWLNPGPEGAALLQAFSEPPVDIAPADAA